jgi:hypothetical protein
MESIIQEEARLVILKELAKQPNNAITSEAMRRFLLEGFLIDKPRQWVEKEFAYLRDMSAITITQADSVQIARLADRGRQHLRGLITIAGVLEPSSTGV